MNREDVVAWCEEKGIAHQWASFKPSKGELELFEKIIKAAAPVVQVTQARYVPLAPVHGYNDKV